MKKNKNSSILMLMVSAGVLLLGIGAAVAYISVSNANGARASVTTAENLVLSYTDCASSKVEDCQDISAELNPGDSIVKTFEIKNDSERELNYTLYFKELYNTFKNGDLVYKIENMTTGEVVLEETPVPEFDVVATNQVAMTHKVSKGETQELKMTITFLNREYNQVDNVNAEFDMKITIG